MKAFRDPWFVRTFIISAALLTGLLVLAASWAGRRADMNEIAGSYHSGSAWLLDLSHLPKRIDLRPDGTISISGDGILYEGTWRWDEAEGIVRVQDPRWDHRIRLRNHLFGTRLTMRISDLTLDIDHPEHDEEVELVKD